MAKNSEYFLNKKQKQEKITMLTCYDYPTACLEEQAGIDIILVGDSLGTNVLGYESETEVTLADMIHHLKAVRRGVSEAYILVDLPFGTYDNPQIALTSARKLIENGADGVKLEGFKPEIITHLVNHQIQVCGHLGLLPQTQTKKSLQGKTFEAAKILIENSLDLEKSGVFLLLFELIPAELGKIITQQLTIPTIGIGAGKYTDGQVLVVNDILGITPRKLSIFKKYSDFHSLAWQAINTYKQEVENNIFPAQENSRNMDKEELHKLQLWLQQKS